jgi:hypothetical protein
MSHHSQPPTIEEIELWEEDTYPSHNIPPKKSARRILESSEDDDDIGQAPVQKKVQVSTKKKKKSYHRSESPVEDVVSDIHPKKKARLAVGTKKKSTSQLKKASSRKNGDDSESEIEVIDKPQESPEQEFGKSIEGTEFKKFDLPPQNDSPRPGIHRFTPSLSHVPGLQSSKAGDAMSSSVPHAIAREMGLNLVSCDVSLIPLTRDPQVTCESMRGTVGVTTSLRKLMKQRRNSLSTTLGRVLQRRRSQKMVQLQLLSIARVEPRSNIWCVSIPMRNHGQYYLQAMDPWYTYW